MKITYKDNIMNFNSRINQQQLVNWRRLLHQHAESGLSEFWTTAFIAKTLADEGLDVKVGPQIADQASVMGRAERRIQAKRLENALAQGADPIWIEKMDGVTGLIVDIRPDLPMRTAFRFDIDCVDVRESDDPEHLPCSCDFASINNGQMHACGHDGHAAIGIGVALALAKEKHNLKHNVRLIFEPGEEGSRGAAPMIKAGAVDGARYFFTAHIGCSANALNTIICGVDGFLATTKFDVEYNGRSSHSGFEPHMGKNSLLAAACAALNLHALPRHGQGETRITVGRLTAGSGRNVIADHAKMICETRGITSEIDDFMFDAAQRVIKHAAGMYEQEYKITIMGKTGSALSDPEMIKIIQEVAEEIPYFAKGKIIPHGKAQGTDDACAFISAVQCQGGMGAYALIGSPLPAGHHNPRFDFNEEILEPAVELFCRAAHKLDQLP